MKAKPTYEELEILLQKALDRIAEQEKLIAQLQECIAHLQDRLNKNSRNSSKPPPSDQKPNRSSLGEKSKRKASHAGATRQPFAEEAITSRILGRMNIRFCYEPDP